MRKSCVACALKHLAQAEILLTEAALGYPKHRLLAIGHLAEAESEILALSSSTAKDIRTSRMGIDSGVPLPYEKLVDMLLELEDKK